MRISDWSSDVCSSDLPIYINLAPNYDMTLEPRLMTKRGLMLNTEFRYLTPTGRGKFDFGYLPSDDLTSSDREGAGRVHRGTLSAAEPQQRRPRTPQHTKTAEHQLALKGKRTQKQEKRPAQQRR